LSTSSSLFAAQIFLSHRGLGVSPLLAPAVPALAGVSAGIDTHDHAVLVERIEKLSETQRLIDGLLKDIQNAQASAPVQLPQQQQLPLQPLKQQPRAVPAVTEALRGSVAVPSVAAEAPVAAKAAPAGPAASAATAVAVPSAERPARRPSKTWISSGDIFDAPNPRGGLPCAGNATIRVSRAHATALGVHWYDRASAKCALTSVSHKMEPGCGGPGNDGANAAKQRQLLVVGVQRSGTHYTWEMFNRLGVHVHHEGLGPDGAVSWLFAYKSDGGYAINNPEPLANHKFCFVFHQVCRCGRCGRAVVVRWACGVRVELCLCLFVCV